MKIFIKDSDAKKALKISLPTTVVIFIAKIIFFLDIHKINKDEKIAENDQIKQNKWNLTDEDLKVIIQALKHMNKSYKGLALVDIESNDGDIVKIII